MDDYELAQILRNASAEFGALEVALEVGEGSSIYFNWVRSTRVESVNGVPTLILSSSGEGQ